MGVLDDNPILGGTGAGAVHPHGDDGHLLSLVLAEFPAANLVPDHVTDVGTVSQDATHRVAVPQAERLVLAPAVSSRWGNVPGVEFGVNLAHSPATISDHCEHPLDGFNLMRFAWSVDPSTVHFDVSI